MKILFTACLLFSVSCPAFTLAAPNCDQAGNIYDQAMQLSDAGGRIRLLTPLAESCPGNFNVLYELGRGGLKNGRLAEADQWFSRAIILDPGPEAKGKAFVGLALVLEQQGQVADAMAMYRQGLKEYHFPGVADHVRDLDFSQHEQLVASAEISRSLTGNDSRGFSVEPGINLPVQFAYNRSDLTKKGMAQAAELGEALVGPDMQGMKIILIGHTDRRGSDDYNLQLSGERAETVKQFLIINFAIQPTRIQTSGRGEKELLYFGDDEKDHALNRRVEVKRVES